MKKSKIILGIALCLLMLGSCGKDNIPSVDISLDSHNPSVEPSAPISEDKPTSNVTSEEKPTSNTTSENHTSDATSEEKPTSESTSENTTSDVTSEETPSVEPSTSDEPVHEHNYVAEITPATCIAEGYTTHTCECGDVYIDTPTPKTAHDPIDVAATLPTCTEPGYAKGKRCSVCNEIISGCKERAPYGHTYEDASQEVSCEKPGFVGQRCAGCGDIISESIIPALGHDYKFEIDMDEEDNLLYPTRTEVGYAKGDCQTCGKRAYVELPNWRSEEYTKTYDEKGLEVLHYDYEGCDISFKLGDGLYPGTPHVLTEVDHTYTGRTGFPYWDMYVFYGEANTAYEIKISGGSFLAYAGIKPYNLYSNDDAGRTQAAMEADFSQGSPVSSKTFTVKSDSIGSLRFETYLWNGSSGIKVTVSKVPPHEHDFDVKVVAPTCEEGGYTQSTCKICKEVVVTDKLDPLGHDMVEFTQAATCSEQGKIGTKCSHCGQEDVTAYTPKLSHTYEEAVVSSIPTNTATGKASVKCSVCNTTTNITLPVLTNTSYEVTENADYSKTYSYTHTSTGKVVTFNVAHEHTYGEAVIVPSTCEKAGSSTSTCTVCGDVKTEEIAKLEHNYEDVTVASTCKEAGYTNQKCSLCGDETEKVALPLVDHTYGEAVIVPSTCEKAGSSTSTCTVCGDVKTEEIAKLEHNYEDVTVASTCKEAGYTSQKCSLCGDETEKVALPLADHTYGEAVVTLLPTSENKGTATITCANCDDVVTIELPLLTSTSYTVVTSDEDGKANYTYTDEETGKVITFTADIVEAVEQETPTTPEVDPVEETEEINPGNEEEIPEEIVEE